MTHTIMSGGTLHVPEDLYDEFLGVYAREIERGNFSLAYSEKRTPEVFRMYFDLDLLHTKAMDEADLLLIVREVQRTVLLFFAGADEAMKCVVSRTQTKEVEVSVRPPQAHKEPPIDQKLDPAAPPVEDPKPEEPRYETFTKNGVHLNFPKLLVNLEMALQIRFSVVNQLEKRFGQREIMQNPWSDVVDKAPYFNGLKMIGSVKREQCNKCGNSKKRKQCGDKKEEDRLTIMRDIARIRRKYYKRDDESFDYTNVMTFVGDEYKNLELSRLHTRYHALTKMCCQCNNRGWFLEERYYSPTHVLGADGVLCCDDLHYIANNYHEQMRWTSIRARTHDQVTPGYAVPAGHVRPPQDSASACLSAFGSSGLEWVSPGLYREMINSDVHAQDAKGLSRWKGPPVKDSETLSLIETFVRQMHKSYTNLVVKEVVEIKTGKPTSDSTCIITSGPAAGMPVKQRSNKQTQNMLTNMAASGNTTINKDVTMRVYTTIVVDPSSGLVGVSSMMQCANPEVHPGSILRSVNGVLKDVTGVPAMTKRSINQKSTVVAELSTCNYILDHLPGKKWVAWRQASGEAFKRSLAERVEQVRAGTAGGDADGADDAGQEPEMHNETETKASVLEKSLRTIGIVGSIRVDEASGKGSVIDVIKLLCPGATGDYATHALTRVINRDAGDDDGADQTGRHSIADRVDYIQINGKGHTTPVSDAKTITEIIWLLPARAAKEFRRQSAETICRVLSGDTSICEEIESRCARLQGSDEGRAFVNFMSGESEVSPPKRARIGPEIMELASEEQYQAYVSCKVQRQVEQETYETHIQRANNEVSLVKTEVNLVMTLKEAFEQIRPLDSRGEIELRDRIFDIQHRAFRRVESVTPPALTAPTEAVDAMVVATPAAAGPTDPGTSVPTPECPAAVRGNEISIAMVSTELGIGLGEKAGQVGKRMKALYSERYGSVAAANIPKRATIFRGKPFAENTYYSRDKDLMEQAIRDVCGLAGSA
eukprot:g16370.t1